MSTPNICFQCLQFPQEGQSNFQRCGRCQSRYYCSTHCQRLDWTVGEHKRKCQPATETSTLPALEMIQGIRLRCRKEGGGFIGNPIPSNHSIFDRHILPVPGLLEIPLVIHRTGTEAENDSDLDCQIATYLAINPVSGYAPAQWLSRVGTCVVARKDKKALSQEHMDAVHTFIDRLLDDFGGEGPEKARENMTRKNFEGFEERYKRENLLNHRSEWKDVGSIYDL